MSASPYRLRGIERKAIFWDALDYENFLDRLVKVTGAEIVVSLGLTPSAVCKLPGRGQRDRLSKEIGDSLLPLEGG